MEKIWLFGRASVSVGCVQLPKSSPPIEELVDGIVEVLAVIDGCCSSVVIVVDVDVVCSALLLILFSKAHERVLSLS